jgi:hypothetical protein
VSLVLPELLVRQAIQDRRARLEQLDRQVHQEIPGVLLVLPVLAHQDQLDRQAQEGTLDQLG